MKKIFAFLFFVCITAFAVQAQTNRSTKVETPAQRDARMAWWREAKFGLFIHWGLYAIPAGPHAEWTLLYDKIPVADYKQYAAQFNPTNFNADAWVALAKAAGIKYMVITAKHHDGFAMYASKVNSFNVVEATPFKRDPLAELNAACQKAGIKLGFYYSQNQDWTAPGGSAASPHWDKAQDGDFKTYIETKALPQVTELLNNYQPAPAVLWYDTPNAGKNMTPEIAAEFVKVTDQHPNLIWNGRLGGGYAGDTKNPEQYIPPQGYPGMDWETCMTINDSWGYKKRDHNFKSTEMLLHNLIDIASKGGNYLLNVGPDATGVIPQTEQDRLRDIGQWLQVNGEAVYGTGPTPFSEPHGQFSDTKKDRYGKPEFIPVWDWRATTKPGKIYLEIFKWPTDGKFEVPGLQSKVEKAYLLAGHKKVKFEKTGSGVTLELPAQALDKIASVICLEIADTVANVSANK